MFIIKIHLIFSAAVFIFMLLWASAFVSKVKRLGMVRKETKTIQEKVFGYTKTIIACLIPIFNLMLICNVMFNTEATEKQALEEYELKGE